MISKNLIRLIGLLNIVGPVLYIIYRGLDLLLIEGSNILDNIVLITLLFSIKILAIAMLLISIAGVYFLLSSALKHVGLVSLFLLFLGYLLIAGEGYLQLAATSSGNILLNPMLGFPSIPMIIAYSSAGIGYIIIGLLLRKHKLFKPAITISIAIGGFVFFGSNFAKESSLMVEIIGMVFLFVMGLIPMGWQVYKMYQKK